MYFIYLLLHQVHKFYDLFTSIFIIYNIHSNIFFLSNITVFFSGLVHLESLELLSKQSQMKLQTVLLSCSGTQLTNIQDTLEKLKELCYFDCDDDEKQLDNEEFKTSLVSCINEISVDVKTEKMLRV